MKGSHREGRSWPGYLFGGRLRTSTAALLIAFFGIWWLYDTYQPEPSLPQQVPASDVVPPGFIPDPSYTWVPRTDVQPRTDSTTPTTTPTTSTSSETTSPSSSTSEAPSESPTTSGESSTAPSSSATITAPASTPAAPSASSPAPTP